MNKKKIFCDIDSTINNHRERIKRNTIGGWPGTVIDPKAFTRGEVLKDLPIPEALSALNKLNRLYSVHFLTSRVWDYPEGALTKEWLDLHGFKYGSVNIVKSHHDKVNFLAKVNPYAYIDDFTIYQEREYLEVLNDLILSIRSKCTCIVFRYNNNWSQILNELQ